MSAATESEGTMREKSVWDRWIYLDLHWGEAVEDLFPIVLTISFGEDFLQVTGGKVWFGLNGGGLQLTAENAMLPHKYRWPDTPIEVKISIKRSKGKEQLSRNKRSQSSNAGFKADLKGPSGSVNINNKREEEAEQKTSVTDEFECSKWQIYTRGSNEDAYWDFATMTGEPCLKGRLVDQEIAKVEVTGRPVQICGKFNVYKRNIKVIDSEGFLPGMIKKLNYQLYEGRMRKEILAQLSTLCWSAKLTLPY